MRVALLSYFQFTISSSTEIRNEKWMLFVALLMLVCNGLQINNEPSLKGVKTELSVPF